MLIIFLGEQGKQIASRFSFIRLLTQPNESDEGAAARRDWLGVGALLAVRMIVYLQGKYFKLLSICLLMRNREAWNLAVRYFVLIILGLFNLWLFYLIFSPLTVYPVYFILKLIDSSAGLFPGNLIFFSGEYIEIVEACIAGAAYYLLLIFNLATPMEWRKRMKSSGEYIEIVEACIAGAAYYLLLIFNLATSMEWRKRMKSIAFLAAGFLVLNVLRILVFTALFVVGYRYFDATHIFIWYFGSTALIVLLWFVNVWLFDIKEIPVYSDIKSLYFDVF